MNIRILGGGWYGCHLAMDLLSHGHEVELWETSSQLFAGASGANPARLHLGFHYPRSKLTRAMSQEHYAAFMKMYGSLTRAVPVNIYAVADKDSVVDFGNYCQVLKGEVEYITVTNPTEFGLRNVEGALLTGERHILIKDARKYFTEKLAGHFSLGEPKLDDHLADSRAWDWTIDCTFCSLDSANIERYEPCITTLLRGPTDKAITIMDGPFPSIYPWDEEAGLCSLTSALYTPFARCKTYAEAVAVLSGIDEAKANTRAVQMYEQMFHYYPDIVGYSIDSHMFSIRAMPRSGADARLVDVVKVGERVLRIRAGKIDAVAHAAQTVRAVMAEVA